VHKNHLSHPPSLRTFFATEMWERYGFYVVQTLLALYLALHFEWNDKRVYSLVGSFTALTYISPVIGGWIADHLLGQKRAILLGAVALMVSYISVSYVITDQGLTAALAGIAVGTGLLKPNISSLLGNEYPVGSPKRESGFTIFYMGLTTGIILGTTLPSYLNAYFGWSVSFMSAAIGMVIAIATFSFGIYRHRIQDYHPFEFQLKKIVLAAMLMLLLWLSAFYILNYPAIADGVFIGVAILSLAYLLYCVKTESTMQARQTMVILLLCVISVAFWAFYFQMFLSLTLFIARIVEPTLFGVQFTPPYYVGIQSFGMIILGLILTRRKHVLKHTQEGIQTGNKFLLAMVFTTIAYILITYISHSGTAASLLSPLYIVPAYLMLSCAELLLSPVGLSAITMLASPKKVSTMMGIFFVSLGIGGFLSGKLAELTAIPVGETETIVLKAHYASSFTYLLYILIGATLICAFLNVIIRYLMKKPCPIPQHS
jgi:POT family proton-dependent oligopeptide transporter